MQLLEAHSHSQPHCQDHSGRKLKNRNDARQVVRIGLCFCLNSFEDFTKIVLQFCSCRRLRRLQAEIIPL